MEHVIKATPRQEKGKVLAKFRRAGKVPANIFKKHSDSSQIWVDGAQLKKAIQTAGEGSLLYVELEGNKNRVPTIIRHIDYDVRQAQFPIHATFQEISLKEEVTVEIELAFIGEAEATKSGLIVDTPQTYIEIKALPTALPEKIEVDVTSLATIDDRITAGEVQLPKGVTLVTDPEAVLVAIVEPMAEEPEETAATDEATEVAAVEVTEEKSKQTANE